MAAGFAAGTVLWTLPLAGQLATHLPGSGLGDNASFLWNFWWMRVALASGADVFRTALLFSPEGADLTLHTHTALPAFAGATLLAPLSVVSALNVTILISLLLNAVVAYLLAWRITGDRGASVVAGVIFGGSPFIAAHLAGHFNLTTAWTLPLFVLAMSRTLEPAGQRWAVAAGALLGATAYIDYYYVVFQLAFAAGFVIFHARQWSVLLEGPSPRRVLARVAGGLAVILALLLLAIGVSGGFAFAVGPLRVSARSAFNPLQAFWAALAVWLWLRFRPRVTAAPARFDRRAVGRSAGLIAAVFIVVAAPLLWKAAALVLRGDYTSQEYLWRSAPKGVDVATLLLGNPWQGIWGPAIRELYRALQIDAIESSAWLGVAPMLLATLALRRHWADGAVRLWAAAGGCFAVWALGPHLMAFGANTGMILPQTLGRYVPIVANARIPGRAMVMVYLALAVLAAIGLADVRRRSRRPALVLMVAAVTVIADYLPAPVPTVALTRPPIYEVLRTRTEPGSVLELPLGVRDGFGEQGRFDDSVLYYQSLHQRPMAGGFVARVPRSVLAAFAADPLLSALLGASGSQAPVVPLPGRDAAGRQLAANGIRFVVLNRELAQPALVDYVERVLPLTAVVHEGRRSLYLVAP